MMQPTPPNNTAARPSVCVPLAQADPSLLLKELERIKASAPDLIEWRVDYLPHQLPEIDSLQKQLYRACGSIPMIVTWRTLQEGGHSIKPDCYHQLLCQIITSGCADLIDVEFSTPPAVRTELLALARQHSVPVIISSHNFSSTPATGDMLAQLEAMRQTGADVVKLAVMPKSSADVLALLTATCQFHSLNSEVPLITMSMGQLGAISRIAGAQFGSCVTFASVTGSSAPGQIELATLRPMLDTLYQTPPHAFFRKTNNLLSK